jgi:hypothetical protein
MILKPYAQHGRCLAALGAAVVLVLASILTLTGFGAPAGNLLEAPVVASAQAGALVRVGDGISSTFAVAPGGQVTVPVEVVDAVNLSAATVLLSYDPAVVHAVGCAGPQSGVFDGGLCNVEYDLGVVKFNVVAQNGVTGTYRLFDITFEAVGGGVGATATDLTLTVEHFADPQGNGLAVGTAGGRIEVVGTPAPVDGVVRVGDAAHSDFTLIPGNSIDISMTLSITGPHALGAATILLRYDPQVVRPTRCAQADPIQGFCNPAFDPQAGLVKFNLLSSDGLTGTIHPYDVRFEVASGAPADAVSDLVLIVEHFADTGGVPMSWQALNGTITVAAGQSNSAQVLVGAPAETGAYTVTLGMTVTVSVWVTDVVGLGAATISLSYDPTVVRALGCDVRSDLWTDGGACALLGDRVRTSIIAPYGLNGDARLYDVVFTPAVGAAVGATSTLTLTVENFADTAAIPVPSRVRNGLITVEAGGAGPPVALVRVGDDANGGAFELPQDDRVVVPIRVEGADGLGAATLSLNYDPAVVRPVSCTAVYTGFDGGTCNPWAGAGLVRMNVAAAGGFTGDATLFDVTFQAADGAAQDDQTHLTLTATTFDSPAGAPLLYRTAAGTIDIVVAVGPPEVILRVGEGPYQIGIGERLTIPVSATIGTITRPLGAATLVLGYDPAVVQPRACTLNAAAANGFDGGTCNLHYATGQIKLNALSVTGVTSETTIVEIEFQAVGQGGDITSLALTVDHLADPAGNALTFRAQPGSIGIPPVDGNGDTIPDSRQANVISVRNAVDGRFVTLASPGGTTLQDVSAIGNPSPQNTPGGVDFPVGFVGFKVQGIEAGGGVTVTLFPPAGMKVVQYFKYGPTPDDPTQRLYEFDFDETTATGTEIQGDRVILHFVDGQRGDADLVANGEIVDPGGPAVCDPASEMAVGFVTSSSILQSPSSIILTARVSNPGSVPVPAGTTVNFYRGDPNAGGSTTLTTGGSLIGTATTTQVLDPGASEVITVTWATATPGDHQIFMVADDPAPGLIAECSAGSTTQQTVSILDVPLVEGWNLISSYVNPFNTDVSIVQRPIEGQYVVIEGFDQGAQSYYPDLPAAVNTLQEIDGKHGYWVKVKPTGTQGNLGELGGTQGNSPEFLRVPPSSSSSVQAWRFVGTKFAEDRSLSLAAGWNLVSYLPRKPLAVRDALQSIAGQYFVVLGYPGRALSFYPDLDDSFNTLHTLEPLFGYWIKMVEAGTLQYPATTRRNAGELKGTRGNSGELRGTQGTARAGESPVSSSEFLRVPPSSSEFFRVLPSSSKFLQVPPSSSEFLQVPPSSPQFLGVPPSSTWVNFYGSTSLPTGTLIQAIDPDGVVCGAAVVTTEGQYGLLACYGDDPTTPEDEGAQPGDTVRLVAGGQELGTGTWTAHGGRQWVPLGEVQMWKVWLVVVSR